MKKYFYSLMLLVMSAMLFISCEGVDGPDDPIIIDPTYVSQGLFVLNEGNYYDKINGSLSYIDYNSGSVVEDVFQDANQRSLGGTPNDMVAVLDRIVICCTDENRVEIADARTGKSLSCLEVPQPRFVCTSTFGVYVSSYDGTVYSISYEGKLLGKSPKVGDCLEGIYATEHYVYVCNSYTVSESGYTYNTNVVKLDKKTLEKVADITVACNPTRIAYANDHLYVLSTGNYADVQSQIQTIDKDDKVQYLCDATHMALDDLTLYAINSVTDWTTYETKTDFFRIDLATGKRSPLISDADAKAVFSPCGIAADFAHQCFYISSYSPDSYGYADYSGNGYVMQFNYDGAFQKRYDVGVGPSTMVPFVVEVYNE